MRKLLLFLLLNIFIINSVLALDCQYKVNESYEVEDFYFKEGSNYLDYKVLEIKNFQQSSRRGDKYITYSTSPVKFDIKNNYLKQIEFSLIFIMDGEEQRINQTLDSEEFKTIQYGYPNNIDSSTFKFKIISPSNLKYTFEKRVYKKEVCKLCGNEICLNDGASCNPLYDDSKCGSGICNIAGFCGSQKIVDCPNRKLNCQDKICLEPSTKERGESYRCSFECKSDRFENGTCLKSSLILQEEKDKRNKDYIIFGVLVLIILSAGIGYFAFFKRKKEEKLKNQILEEKNALLDEIDNLKKNKENLQKSIKSLNSEIENMSLLIDKGKNKISSLKKEIKDTEGKAKEELEKRLKFEEQKQKNRIFKLKKQREKLEKEEERIITIEKNLVSKKLKFEKENKEFFIKKALDKYKQRYPNIFYDEKEGYIKFSNNGDYLHRFIYRRKFDKNLGNKVVHHIDTDKLNNEDWNLISIPYEKHKELNHTLINSKNWESGIKEIKRALNWEDTDFPEHIQKKIKEERQQKKLKSYVHRSTKKRKR